MHNTESGKKFNLIGFRNDDGGYELRSGYFKGTVGKKYISFVRGNKPQPEGIHIFEGFMDYLSALLKHNKGNNFVDDALILNSLSLLSAATPFIQGYGYSAAYSWMDNDAAGKKATQLLDEFFKTEDQLIHQPMNHLYADHKDVMNGICIRLEFNRSNTLTQSSIQSLFAVTEVELIYRNKVNPLDRPKVISSSNAYDVLLQAWDLNKIELVEEFVIMLLDRSNACLGISKVSKGGISACPVDPKIVFATALKARASALILAHNHPSGITKPSQADIALTQKLKEGGALMDLSILDHLIISPRQYFSFADEGLLCPE